MSSWELLRLTAILVLMGVGLAWGARHVIGSVSKSTITALILLPVIVALLLSGRLEEFSVFGISAKLQRIAEKPVIDDAHASPAQSASDSFERGLFEAGDILGTDAPKQDRNQLAFWGQSIRVMTIKASGWKTPIPVTEKVVDERLERAIPIAVVIYNSLRSGSFQAFVVLDGQNRPLGVFEPSYFYDLLRIPLDVLVPFGRYAEFVPNEDELRAKLQQTGLWSILSAPEVRADAEGNKAWISGRASRLEALRIMLEKRFDVLVATADDGRYLGVVSRDDLIGKLLVGAIGQSSAH